MIQNQEDHTFLGFYDQNKQYIITIDAIKQQFTNNLYRKKMFDSNILDKNHHKIYQYKTTLK